MAGAGLIAIKRRVKSITNTKKITKAMSLVATAKLRKSRAKLIINDNYFTYCKEVIKLILNNYTGDSIYTKGNTSNKKLYIVFTSDTGLCGSFNGTIVNRAIEEIGEDKDNSLVMVIGRRGKNYFNKMKYETAAEYVDVPDLPTIKEAEEITRHALELYKKGTVGRIYIVFTKFISAVKLTPSIEKLLPMDTKMVNDYQYDEFITFEPKIDDIIENSIYFYIKEQIFNLMLNSKASEQSSRMRSMDGATKNANDLLDRLNLLYNRIRQSSITSEISEIVGGAEAQK